VKKAYDADTDKPLPPVMVDKGGSSGVKPVSVGEIILEVGNVLGKVVSPHVPFCQTWRQVPDLVNDTRICPSGASWWRNRSGGEAVAEATPRDTRPPAPRTRTPTTPTGAVSDPGGPPPGRSRPSFDFDLRVMIRSAGRGPP
jgi:hypothetical protein